MTPARQRERELFEKAFDLTDPVQRQSFLDRSCDGEPALRARLERLLAAQAPAESLLTLQPRRASTGEIDDSLLAKSDVRIGRYRLLQRLGEGGCGVVYLAEQQEPVSRQVALKIIRLGIGTRAIIAHFRMEQQAMAWMDHPNIARVLDAGETPTGRPYFVMELVRGIRITDYCDRHRLDVRARLGLFIQVCHAIQHAHQKGVIHRDIKPSNILIALHDERPMPKVIDFGIAQPIEEALPEETGDAGHPRMAGTPDYMSPEQAKLDGRDVDTRSDIHGLGVLLHELLTGRRPFDFRNIDRTDVQAVLRAVRERPAPPAPSLRLASLPPEDLALLAEQRSVAPRALIASLHGDLDRIVLRALEKDRQRRYETANGLALDIRRHLDHEPVSAHPASRFYHFGKLVRRNRQVFVAGALVLATLVAGLGTSTWLFVRERTARREAERARATEAALREHAEAREKIARAAVLISHGDIPTADALVAAIPLDLTPSSLECANVLRTLGEWHTFAGRWEPAAQRFAGLARAITQADSADTDDVSRNLLPAGAAILEAGDVTAYEQFRVMALARFARSANPIAAEHTIKSCLLAPADARTLAALTPLAQVVITSLGDTDPKAARNPYMAAWRTFALVLLAYRQGNDLEAIDWQRRCESYPDENPARLASCRLVLAMACHRLHRDDQARAALQQGRELVDARFRAPLNGGADHQGLWFDWINARILLREASASIGD